MEILRRILRSGGLSPVWKWNSSTIMSSVWRLKISVWHVRTCVRRTATRQYDSHTEMRNLAHAKKKTLQRIKTTANLPNNHAPPPPPKKMQWFYKRRQDNLFITKLMDRQIHTNKYSQKNTLSEEGTNATVQCFPSFTAFFLCHLYLASPYLHKK